jgi:hypothetical protein
MSKSIFLIFLYIMCRGPFYKNVITRSPKGDVVISCMDLQPAGQEIATGLEPLAMTWLTDINVPPLPLLIIAWHPLFIYHLYPYRTNHFDI